MAGLVWTLKQIARRKGYRIEEVPGYQVSDDAVAETYFNDKIIRIPDYGRSGEWTPLKKYVLGHEVLVEACGRPRNDREHAKLEKDYLKELRDSRNWREFFTGLAMHKLRNKHGERKWFRTIAGFLDNQVREYRNDVDGWAIPKIAEAYALDI